MRTLGRVAPIAFLAGLLILSSSIDPAWSEARSPPRLLSTEEADLLATEFGQASTTSSADWGQPTADNDSTPPLPNWSTFLYSDGRTADNPAETTINVSNVANLTSRWTFSGIGAVTGSLIEVDGIAYFGAWDGYLYAVNAYNGSLKWKADLGGAIDYTGCQMPGIAATPTFWNDTIYIGGSNPWFYAVNATSGSVLWHLDLANYTGSSSPWWAYKIWSSALVYNGSVYVGTSSGCDNPLVRAALFQVAPGSGAVEHVFWTDPPGRIGASIWSSPSVDPYTDTLWVTTGNEFTGNPPLARAIVELNASNVSELLGYAQEAIPGQDFDFGDGATLLNSTTGTPMVVAANKNGYAYAFNDSALVANGSSVPRWVDEITSSPGIEFVPPAYDGRMLYFVGDNATLLNATEVPAAVEAIYPDNGTVAWVTAVPGLVDAGVTYADGLLFVGLATGGLVALRASDGKILLSLSTPKIFGEPIVLNGELLFGFGDIFNSSVPGGVAGFSLPPGGQAAWSPVGGTPYSTFMFRGTGNGGILPYNYTWSFGDDDQGFGDQATHPYSAGGRYNVTFTVRESGGSQSVTTYSVQALDPLIARPSFSGDPAVVGTSLWINLSLSGAALPYTVAWTGLPPGSPSQNLSDPTLRIVPSAVGYYNISAVVTSPSGQATEVEFPELTVVLPSTSSLPVFPIGGAGGWPWAVLLLGAAAGIVFGAISRRAGRAQ